MATVPAAPPVEGLEGKFQRLAETWRAETAYLSSSTAMIDHPAYQEIIRMGPPVVPMLLRDLAAKPEHWHWALRSITGANPVPDSASGRLPEIAEAWLGWAKEHGYQW